MWYPEVRTPRDLSESRHNALNYTTLLSVVANYIAFSIGRKCRFDCSQVPNYLILGAFNPELIKNAP